MAAEMNTLLGRVFPVKLAGSKTKLVCKFSRDKFLALADEVKNDPERFVSAYTDAISGAEVPQVTVGIFETSRGGLLAALWENRNEATNNDEMPD